MIIGCTKKVLDFMGVAPVEERGDVNPLFSWTLILLWLTVVKHWWL